MGDDTSLPPKTESAEEVIKTNENETENDDQSQNEKEVSNESKEKEEDDEVVNDDESVESLFKKLQSAESKSLLKKYLTKEIFDKLKDQKTSQGCDLKSCI